MILGARAATRMIIACVAWFGAGCTNALLFTTATQTGIELNAVEGGRQTIRVGYNRAEGVVMPVRESADGPPRTEAFAVLSASHFETGTLLLGNPGATKIKTVFATGQAATTRGAPAAVGNTFKAMVGSPFSAEASWLRRELRTSFLTLAADPTKGPFVRTAVWNALAGGGAPSVERYAIVLVQRQTNTEALQEMLLNAKQATTPGATLTDVERKDPKTALIRLIVDTHGDAQAKVLDAIGPSLPGPDQISTMTGDEIVLALIDQAAERDDTTDLRAALTATLKTERQG